MHALSGPNGSHSYFGPMRTIVVGSAIALMSTNLFGQDPAEIQAMMPELVQCRADWHQGDTTWLEVTRTKLNYTEGTLTSKAEYTMQLKIVVEDSSAAGYRLKWQRFAELPEIDAGELPVEYRDAYEKIKALDIHLLTDTNGTLLEILDREIVIDRWIELMRSFLPMYIDQLDEEERTRFQALEANIWQFRELLSKELIEEIQLYFSPYGLYLNTRRPYTADLKIPNVITSGEFPAKGTYSISIDNANSYRINVDVAVDSVAFRKEINRAIRSIGRKVEGSQRTRERDLPWMNMSTSMYFILDTERSWVQEMKYRGEVRSAAARVVETIFITTTVTAAEPNTLMKWDAVIDAAPNDPSGYVERAKLLAGRGDHRGAIEDLTMALSLNDSAHQVYFYRSFNWKAIDQNERSKSDLLRAMELAPDSLSYQVGFADLLVEERNYAEAQERLERILELDERCSQAWYSLGIIHRQLYRFQDAIDAFTRVIELTPGDGYVLAHRASARAGLRTHEQDSLARLDLAASLELSPDNPAVLATIGNQLLASSEPDSAIHYFDRLVALDPNDAMAIHNRGYAHLLAGRYDMAINDMLESLEINVDFAYAHNNLGRAYHLKGDDVAALASIQRSIEMDPSNAYAYYNQGIVLRALGRSTEACNSWQLALARGFREGYGDAVDKELRLHCR